MAVWGYGRPGRGYSCHLRYMTGMFTTPFREGQKQYDHSASLHAAKTLSGQQVSSSPYRCSSSDAASRHYPTR